jgi:hypothetical protein
LRIGPRVSARVTRATRVDRHPLMADAPPARRRNDRWHPRRLPGRQRPPCPPPVLPQPSLRLLDLSLPGQMAARSWPPGRVLCAFQPKDALPAERNLDPDRRRLRPASKVPARFRALRASSRFKLLPAAGKRWTARSPSGADLPISRRSASHSVRFNLLTLPSTDFEPMFGGSCEERRDCRNVNERLTCSSRP